jgi:hypothetical protein
MPTKQRDISIQEVVLDDIDDSPGPFCMSYGFDLGPLASSIRRIGILNPPFLRNDRGNLTVVAGYRRIKALKSLQAAKAPCRLVSGDDMAPIECLLVNLHDNLGTRGLNDMEKGMVLNRLAAWVPREEIVSRYMPLLGLRPHAKTLRFFEELERDLDVKTQTFVAEGGLSWRTVKMLTDMEAASRAALLKAISYLNLSINQQIQFIEILVDLSHIEKRLISELVDGLAIGDGNGGKDNNRPQKAKMLLSQLRARRNPTIVRAEDHFCKTVSHLNLPEGVRITAPPFFESEYYLMDIRFRQGKDLRETLHRLSQKTELDQFKNPWDDAC